MQHTISPPGSQTLDKVTNVYRLNAYGGANAENVADIKGVNSEAKKYVAMFAQPNNVFANYSLIGTVWLKPNTLTPGDDNLNENAIASVNLASSVMETFVQGTQKSNCFMCHNTGGFSSHNIPGKNINISHVILGPLFND